MTFKNICKKCNEGKLKPQKIKFDKEKEWWHFMVECPTCKTVEPYKVAHEHFMGFIMCEEIFSVFGKLEPKKTTGLW